MEPDENDGEEYSKDLKEYIRMKLLNKGSGDMQLLEDLVRQIKHEQQQKKQSYEIAADPVKLSKRKIKKEIQEAHHKESLPGAKQMTLTDFKLKTLQKPKEEVQERKSFGFASKKSKEVFEAVITGLARPKRSSRSKRASDDAHVFPPIHRSIDRKDSVYHTFFHDSLYFVVGSKRSENNSINFLKPLQHYEQVAYDLNSEEEYENLKCEAEGEELTEDDKESQLNSMESLGDEEESFCVSDGHLSADQLSSSGEKKVGVPIDNNLQVIQGWYYTHLNRKSAVPEKCMVHCLETDLPMCLTKEDYFYNRNGERIHEINNACHRNTRTNIISTLKDNFGIQKEEAVDYINGFCEKRVIGKKTVYMVKTIKEQNMLQGNEQQSIGEPSNSRRSKTRKVSPVQEKSPSPSPTRQSRNSRNSRKHG